MAQPSSLTRRATPVESVEIRLNKALKQLQDVEADNARLRKEIETLKTEKDDLLKSSVSPNGQQAGHHVVVTSSLGDEGTPLAQGGAESEALRTALEQLKVCEGDLVKEREALEEEKKSRVFYENEWRSGEVEKEGSRKRIEELEANAVHSREEREEVSGELMSLRMELEYMRKLNETLTLERQEVESSVALKERLQEAWKERDTGRRRGIELQSQITTLEGSLSEQNTMLQEYYGHMREQDNTIESLKSEIESMRGQKKALNSDLFKSLEEKKRLSVELAEADKMVAMLEQKNKEWEGRLDAQLSDNEKMNATMKEYEAECTSLLKDVETITEEAKAARLERDLAQQKVSNLMATLSSRNDEIDRLRAQLGLPQQQQPPPQRPVTLSAVGVGPKQDRDTVGGRLEGQRDSTLMREQPYGITRAHPPGGVQSEVVRGGGGGGGGDGYIRGQTVPAMPYGGRGEMPPRGSMERGGEMPHMGSMERGGGEMPPRASMEWGGGEMPPRGQLGNMQRIASPMNLQPILPPRMMSQQAGQMNQMGQLNQMGQPNQLGQLNQMGQPNQLGQLNQMGQPNQMGPGPIRQASEDRLSAYPGGGGYMQRNASYEDLRGPRPQTQPPMFASAQNRTEDPYRPPSKAMPPPQPPQSVPPPGEGMCNDPCPICGRRGFKTVVELELHSAKCTDFQ